MALPKSFRPLGPNFTPGDPQEALAKEIIAALKENAGTWHQVKRFRRPVDAAAFAETLERLGNERVEVDFKRCVVRARHLPTPRLEPKSIPAPDVFVPVPTQSVVPPAADDTEVIDTSERRGRGRAS